MTNNIAKIRAALEQARELIPEYCGVRTQYDDAFAALAELEKSAAPQFVAGDVTQEMCQRVAASFCGADTFANGVEMREVLQLWRKELGPALGLVELKEPTPEECERVNWLAHNTLDALAETQEVRPEAIGRAMFTAVRAVMWPSP